MPLSISLRQPYGTTTAVCSEQLELTGQKWSIDTARGTVVFVEVAAEMLSVAEHKLLTASAHVTATVPMPNPSVSNGQSAFLFFVFLVPFRDLFRFGPFDELQVLDKAVSYTHLTLPTILRV